FFSSRRRHTRSTRDWSSDVCSSDLRHPIDDQVALGEVARLESALDRLPERQEARAELIRARTEPEVEAGGLVLVVSDRPLGADPPVADGGAELMVGQDAVGYGAQPITRLRAPDVSTSSAHAAPAIPARRSTASIAAATGAPSPATTASSDGPAPLRTQPSAPAARAALTTSGIHGNNRSR